MGFGTGLAAGAANSLLLPFGDEVELLVAPQVFEPGTPLTKEELEDLQIQSAIAAFRCRDRDKVSISRIGDPDEADRAVLFGETTLPIELTAFADNGTRALLHALERVAQRVQSTILASPELSKALAHRQLLLEEDLKTAALKIKPAGAAAALLQSLFEAVAHDDALIETSLSRAGLLLRIVGATAEAPTVAVRTTQSSTSLTTVRSRLEQIIHGKDTKSREYLVIVFDAPVQDGRRVPLDAASFSLLERRSLGPVDTRHLKAVWLHLYGTARLRRYRVKRSG